MLFRSSKMEIIVTFLVVLEMMKLGQIDIEQQGIYDDIIIVSKTLAKAI